jgi:hypothetical protein
MSRDVEHLQLLSVFHYVIGGLALLFSLIPVIHLVLGIMFVRGGFDASTGDPPPAFVGWIFIAFASILIVLGLVFATCLLVAGRCLSRRRCYTFCLVMAAVACLFMPFGTILGVFTIVVLARESVRGLFAATAGPGSPGVS